MRSSDLKNRSIEFSLQHNEDREGLSKRVREFPSLVDVQLLERLEPQDEGRCGDHRGEEAQCFSRRQRKEFSLTIITKLIKTSFR